MRNPKRLVIVYSLHRFTALLFIKKIIKNNNYTLIKGRRHPEEFVTDNGVFRYVYPDEGALGLKADAAYVDASMPLYTYTKYVAPGTIQADFVHQFLPRDAE